MQKTLFIVATPIGNLADISLRAIEVLSAVDTILAEDSRHAKLLLNHYQINRPIISFYEHNEAVQTPKIIQQLQNGKSFALISDAGTPLISDPGLVLVSAAKKAGITVVPIPGPSAVITALSASGISSNFWSFYGFMPTKIGAKTALIKSLLYAKQVSIFYESPKRIVATLILMKKILNSKRTICLAKELTKQFETIKTDTIDIILQWLLADKKHQNGEFVLIITPAKISSQHNQLEMLTKIMPILLTELSPSSSAKIAAKITGLDRKTCYDYAL